MLHYVRFFAPAIVGAMGWLSLSLPGRDFVTHLQNFKLEVQGIGGLVGVVIAGMYFLGDARSRLSLRFSWQVVHQQIETELLRVVSRMTPLSDQSRRWLRQQRRLLNIFYAIIDNDASLTSKQSGVYFNGAILTTVVDVGIVSCATGILHLVAAVVTMNGVHLVWHFGLLGLWLVCEGKVLPMAMRRHIVLSGEQLEVIANHHGRALLERVHEALHSMRQPADG